MNGSGRVSSGGGLPLGNKRVSGPQGGRVVPSGKLARGAATSNGSIGNVANTANVANATNATNAANAANAVNATNATNAANATNAPSATNAANAVNGAATTTPTNTTNTPAGSAASSVPAAAAASTDGPTLKDLETARPARSTETVAAFGIPRQFLDEFTRVYQGYVTDANVAEASAADISRIVDTNFAVYKLISSFLESVRSFAMRNKANGGTLPSDSVYVSLHDLDTLESERELRLLRSIVARNAKSIGLGNEFLASVNPKNLKAELENALRKAASGGGSGKSGDGDGGADDDALEEREPDKVNLDNSGGVYSIRDTSDAVPLTSLVGYEAEARELVSFCRTVRFVNEAGAGGNDTESRRNPVVVVLFGPPGTGKTTIAQSIAHELDSVYMYVNAENVTSQWAGGTEKNISKIFRRARIASKRFKRRVLILIDEIDGLVKNRATSPNLTGEEYSRITTFLQMLTPPIGVDNSSLLVIFTTNRLENVDSAVINRARGRIFMGYVSSPNDRMKLNRQIFANYVRYNDRDQNLQRAIIVCDDLVPRDLQNILARVKNRILERYSAAHRSSILADLEIDLSDQDNRVSTGDLVELMYQAVPGTPVSVLFRDYSPPLSHVCSWVDLNRPYLGQCRSAEMYSRYAKQCN